MSLDSLGTRQTLKKKIYTEGEVKNWLETNKHLKADFTKGETGESFAVYFYPAAGIKSQDLRKIVGHIARLLDEDKPYSRIVSIRFETINGKTALRLGWGA